MRETSTQTTSRSRTKSTPRPPARKSRHPVFLSPMNKEMSQGVMQWGFHLLQGGTRLNLRYATRYQAVDARQVLAQGERTHAVPRFPLFEAVAKALVHMSKGASS